MTPEPVLRGSGEFAVDWVYPIPGTRNCSMGFYAIGWIPGGGGAGGTFTTLG